MQTTLLHESLQQNNKIGQKSMLFKQHQAILADNC